MRNLSKVKVTTVKEVIQGPVKEIVFKDGQREKVVVLDEQGDLSLGGKKLPVVDKSLAPANSILLLGYDKGKNTFVDTGYRFAEGQLTGVVDKVDLQRYIPKETGRQLSEENYTTKEKNKLKELSKTNPIQTIRVGNEVYRGEVVDLPLPNVCDLRGGIANLDDYCEATKGSVAYGYGNKVHHGNCAAFGVGLVSGAANQLLAGQYNEINEEAIFILGDGTYNNPSTLLSINYNGEIGGKMKEQAEEKVKEISLRFEQLEKEIAGIKEILGSLDKSLSYIIEKVSTMEQRKSDG